MLGNKLIHPRNVGHPRNIGPLIVTSCATDKIHKLNTKRPLRNSPNHEDDLFKCSFEAILDETFWYPARISLKFFLWDQVDKT